MWCRSTGPPGRRPIRELRSATTAPFLSAPAPPSRRRAPKRAGCCSLRHGQSSPMTTQHEAIVVCDVAPPATAPPGTVRARSAAPPRSSRSPFAIASHDHRGFPLALHEQRERGRHWRSVHVRPAAAPERAPRSKYYFNPRRTPATASPSRTAEATGQAIVAGASRSGRRR
jgi:hypothetical protein